MGDSMRIAVLVKASVPLVGKLRVDESRGVIIREGPLGLNPWDRDAVEFALSLRDKYGGEVIAISMAPPTAINVMEELIGMGIDYAVLLSDRAFAGSDVYATAKVLALAIKRLGNIDLVVTGEESVDGGTGGVPGEVAAILGIPFFYYVTQLNLVEGRTVRIRRVIIDEGIEEEYEAEMPILISVFKQSQTPREISLIRRIDAKNRISMMDAENLGISSDLVGFSGSATSVVRVYRHDEASKEGVVVNGGEAGARILIEKLQEMGLLQPKRSAANNVRHSR